MCLFTLITEKQFVNENIIEKIEKQITEIKHVNLTHT